jgi:hypothetical protein
MALLSFDDFLVKTSPRTLRKIFCPSNQRSDPMTGRVREPLLGAAYECWYEVVLAQQVGLRLTT